MLFLLCIIFSSLFFGCSHRKEILQQPTFQKISLQENSPPSLPDKENIHELVVFIHGTILGLPSLVLQNLNFRFKDPYLYQPINEIGLHGVSLSNKKNIGTVLAAHNYQRLHEKIHGNDRTFHFYTFGWTGNLSAEGRKSASYDLYKELVTVRDNILKEKNSRVEITLHGHSHGGNVIAYLKDAEEEFHQKLQIYQVGLWGTPIQTETALHFEDPIFTKVYHCYSEKDRVMTLDILSTKKHRSYRRFDKIFKTSPKIAQIKLMVEMMHPTHAELWFLGCINRFLYRKEFALYPFPCLHLAPAIFHATDALHFENKNIILNINNQQNGYLLQIALLKKPEKTDLPLFSDSFKYDLLHKEPLQSLAKYFISYS
jgi:hypothetical protein